MVQVKNFWMDGWRVQGSVKVVTGMRVGHSFINDFFFFYYLYDAWKELSVVVHRVDKTGVMGIKLGVPDCCSLPFLWFTVLEWPQRGSGRTQNRKVLLVVVLILPLVLTLVYVLFFKGPDWRVCPITPRCITTTPTFRKMTGTGRRPSIITDKLSSKICLYSF